MPPYLGQTVGGRAAAPRSRVGTRDPPIELLQLQHVISEGESMSVTFRATVLAASVALLAACGDSGGPAGGTGPAASDSQASGPAAPVPLDQLFAQATAALEAGRVFDPPDNNAMALYLQVSDREDVADDGRRRRLVDSVGGGNLQQQARLAMSDLFPRGVVRVEQAIRAGELEDAARILAMLERARPDASSLQRLREGLAVEVAAARDSLRSTDLESLPPLVSKRLPSYPSRAQRRGIEGWVHLSFAIQEDGSVTEVKVMAAEPERVFDREAIDALQNWRFEAPGRVIRAQRRMEFKLDR
jgi:TonB family protein